jgi:PAS domain-containing protein
MENEELRKAQFALEESRQKFADLYDFAPVGYFTLSPEARILMVADVVEAMASYRPYRPALGIEAALEEIEKNVGVLYDREVVEVCLKLFREKGYKLEWGGDRGKTFGVGANDYSPVQGSGFRFQGKAFGVRSSE